MNGGKRIRGILVYAGALCVQHNNPDIFHNTNLAKIACAVECIHAYSLIHDDLPCMDDDDLRRGKPTAHKVYGEAIALLAGDALQSHAFYLLAQTKDLNNLQYILNYLAHGSGSFGMAGGQSLDILASDKNSKDIQNNMPFSLSELENMHCLKTGALLDTSLCMGILAQDANQEFYHEHNQSIKQLTRAIGLGFQVIDDILDVTQDTSVLGKTAGKDIAQQKSSYVTILGLDKARKQAETLYTQALEAMSNMNIPQSHLLQDIVHSIFNRSF
jgi:geranylgeranyl pyrophosphate synthase